LNIDEKLALRVGSAVLVLVLVGVVGVMNLDRFALARTAKFQVHISHMAGLSESADVQVAGRVIGRVASVRLVPEHTVADDHPLADIGGVTLDIEIDTSHSSWAPINGEFFVSSKGLFGEKYLEVGPPAGGEMPLRGVQDGDQIRGIDPPQMDRTLARTLENLTISRVFLETVGPEARAAANAFEALEVTLAEVEPRPHAYDELFASIGKATAEGGSFADKISNIDVDRARRSIRRIRRNQALLSEGIATVTATVSPLPPEVERAQTLLLTTQVVARLEQAAKELENNLKRAQSIGKATAELAASVRRGEGTVGALINDPEFSDDAKKLGKILKRKPWELFDHPGTKARKYRRVPNPDRRR
jgi:ABC-type transporter Mla subunit MlaD